MSAWRLRWLLNLFPPFLFQRIRVVRLSDDFRRCTVRVGRSVLTRNQQGSMFGGTIFSAADPVYAVLYWQILAGRGNKVQAWLKAAHIRYRKPASSALTLEFELTDDDVTNAIDALARDGRHAVTHRVRAIDAAGDVCASVETEVVLRASRADRPPLSGF